MLILGCPRMEANEFRVLATLELFATVLDKDNADPDLANAGLELFGAEEEFFSKDVPAPTADEKVVGIAPALFCTLLIVTIGSGGNLLFELLPVVIEASTSMDGFRTVFRVTSTISFLLDS